MANHTGNIIHFQCREDIEKVIDCLKSFSLKTIFDEGEDINKYSEPSDRWIPYESDNKDVFDVDIDKKAKYISFDMTEHNPVAIFSKLYKRFNVPMVCYIYDIDSHERITWVGEKKCLTM